MTDARIVDDPAALDALAPAWDELAVACAAPTAAPAWMLGWWRHLAPADAQLRVVAVHEGDELLGVAPLQLVRSGGVRTYRLLADAFSSSVSPLATPGSEWTVAGAVAHALAQAEPPPDVLALDSLPVASHWVEALRDRWPSAIRPLALAHGTERVATIALDAPSCEDYLKTRSTNLRKSMRRRRRMFEEAGGTMRLATADTLADDVAAFVRLHASRWEGRGSSRLVEVADRLPGFLADLGDALLGRERLRLWMAEIDGEPICADLSLVAGGEIVGVNTGWDERFKRMAPAQLVLVRKLEDAFERGERRVDLGWGAYDYKAEFATGYDAVGWTALLPAGPRLPWALGRVGGPLLRTRVRATAAQALTEPRREELRAWRGRLRVRRGR